MSGPRVGDLELEEDLDFQRRVWRAQGIGWALGGIVILAAILGLFGNGPLSKDTASSARPRVEHERFARFRAPTTLTLHADPTVAQNGKLLLWLDRR